MSERRDLALGTALSASAAFLLAGLFVRSAFYETEEPAQVICIVTPVALAGIGVLLGIARLSALDLRDLNQQARAEAARRKAKLDVLYYGASKPKIRPSKRKRRT